VRPNLREAETVGEVKGEGIRHSRGIVLTASMLSTVCPSVPRALSFLLPVFVYQGIKGQAILPAGGEVGNIDVGVTALKKNIKT
jgi:hypothetical protein